MANPARYRSVVFLGNRVLQDRELNKLEMIYRGVDAGNNVTVEDLSALYNDGAHYNIQPNINGATVTFGPIDATKPMLVFARGRWEILQAAEAPPITLTTTNLNVYLNWHLVLRTSTDDPTLIDVTSGQPTAEMAEMVLSVSQTDDAARALANTEFDKNVTTNLMFTFVYSLGNFALLSTAGPRKQTLANHLRAGFVTLSTSTSGGQAVASDDARLGDARAPALASVVDASVRKPVANANGQFDLTTDPGGIGTSKLVHQPTHTTGESAIETARTTANAAQGLITNHVGKALGTGVHPMPTATDVGAAPNSHVGQALGLSTSHPPIMNVDSGGFRVNRSGAPAASTDPAYGVFNGTSLTAGLMHDGDVFAAKAKQFSAAPKVETGDVGLYAGPLGSLSQIALALSQHINKTQNKNPHGLKLTDVGGVDTGYVDSQVAGAIAAAEAYARSLAPGFHFYVVPVSLPSFKITYTPGGGAPVGPQNAGTYYIFSVSQGAGVVEFAIGFGTGNDGDTIPLPNGFYSPARFIGSASTNYAFNSDHPCHLIDCSLQGNRINSKYADAEGHIWSGAVNWTAVCWWNR